MKTITLIAMAGAVALLAGCQEDADIASRNLSKAADNFEIMRKIVFYNGITDAYIATVEGRCSIKADSADRQLEVTCMVGPSEFEKHFLGISDNVTYFSLQTETADPATTIGSRSSRSRSSLISTSGEARKHSSQTIPKPTDDPRHTHAPLGAPEPRHIPQSRGRDRQTYSVRACGWAGGKAGKRGADCED